MSLHFSVCLSALSLLLSTHTPPHTHPLPSIVFWLAMRRGEVYIHLWFLKAIKLLLLTCYISWRGVTVPVANNSHRFKAIQNQICTSLSLFFSFFKAWIFCCEVWVDVAVVPRGRRVSSEWQGKWVVWSPRCSGSTQKSSGQVKCIVLCRVNLCSSMEKNCSVFEAWLFGHFTCQF